MKYENKHASASFNGNETNACNLPGFDSQNIMNQFPKSFHMNKRNIVLWILRLVPALILLQTLYFKFTAHEQSVRLFTELGMEPWGRIGTGIFELVASVLILYPRTTGWGSALGAGLMAGAIFFHLTKLG